MNSTKCPQCGLVYWSTVPNCKRCGLATAGHQPSETEDQFTPPPAEQFMPPPGDQPAYQGYDQRDSYQNPGFNFHDAEKQQLLSTLKKDSWLFYIIGGLQMLLWLLIGNLLIIDGFLNIGLSFLAHKFRSRVAAVLLLCVTVLSVIGAIFLMMMTGATPNLIMPIAMIFRLVASIRMVYTTFKLRGFTEAEVVHVLPPPPPEFYQEGAPQWGSPIGTAQ